MRDMVEESKKDSKDAKVHLTDIKKEIAGMNQIQMSDHNKLSQLPMIEKKID